MDGWQAVYPLRERTVTALEQAAAGRLDPASAAALLEDLRASWTREKRWRNQSLPVPALHVAGPVINSREHRRSCPGFIVDRRQACAVCGVTLVRGRWAVFFAEGALVGVLGDRAPIRFDAAPDTPGLPCSARPRVHPVVVTRATRGGPAYGWAAVDSELRPIEAEQLVLARMHALRDAGRSYRQIAAELNADAVPARHGGSWYPMTVRRALSRHAVTPQVPRRSDKTPYLSAQEFTDEGGVEMQEETP